MKHSLLFIGKTKDRYLSDGIDEFSKRLKHYTGVTTVIIKDPKKANTTEKIKEEQGQLLLGAIPKASFVVVLDAQGKQMTSEAFADFFTKLENRSISSICYVIGGPEGLSKEVLNKADLLLSLSKMTYTHDMVRLLLLEQIYRAYTIKAGEKYHK